MAAAGIQNPHQLPFPDLEPDRLPIEHRLDFRFVTKLGPHSDSDTVDDETLARLRDGLDRIDRKLGLLDDR